MYLSPTVDWLSASYPPGHAPIPEIRKLLLELGAVALPEGLWRFDGGGTVRTKENTQWSGLIVSGAACEHLRVAGKYQELLLLLADCDPLPRVTRLDVAVDVPIHGADVVPQLFETYEKIPFKFNHQWKSVPVTYHSGLSPLGDRTGTVYFGDRNSRSVVIGKVYDKGTEQADRRGVAYTPWTRYEITFRHGTANLKDAAMPDAIFWHHMPGALLPPPGITQIWMPGDLDMKWTGKKSDRLPAAILRRAVEHSSTLESWLKVADEMGPYGRRYLVDLIARAAGVSEAAVDSHADTDIRPPSNPLN